ncbi:hypothetical protein Lal_00023203, partial [Lupinus albus]
FFNLLELGKENTRARLKKHKNEGSVCGRIDLSHIEIAIVVMIDDQDLGFFANFLGISILVLVIAYHFVVAEPKYEGN